jgi:ribulose-5-phosphate 4-epimerase/fuculose-1-phosphate aldolase
MDAPPEWNERARTVALACRILARAGLAEDVLGHVSARLDSRRLLVRCRGPRERGLLFTRVEDVHATDLDGVGELDGGYRVPNELPIHTELMRARADVTAVVHVHSPSVLAADLAGLPLRPVFGAYDIPGYRMARAGVPVYPRAVLVRTPALGREVVESMGEADVCVLRGHGIATVGSSVEQAVVRALTLHRVARLTLELGRLGAVPDVVPDEDALELPDLGGDFNDLTVWNHHVARVEGERDPDNSP